ncbi:ComF family protein, partial [Streptomyces sp. CRN 30]|uniref:ComF family protein n=1 Tax=Streptomyces sp. CRN 30 TaxID=3075613 RepID=UPI0039C34A61
ELRRAGTPARVAAVLRQRRAVADQSRLGPRQRTDNLAGALAVVPGGARLLRDGGRVVLVDDLMTTGASLAEAARAVRAALDGAAPRGAARPGAAPVAGRSGAVGAVGCERIGGVRPYRTATRAVYPGAVWEGREQRRTGATEVRADGTPAGPVKTGGIENGDVIRAAVVAASPDSFEINRN